MDQEQKQMQSLGFLGIFRESYKFIISYRYFFAQITLSLILPLTFIFLALLEISNLQELISHNTKGHNNLSDTFSSEWITFWLFKVGCITIFLILSLLSTGVAVYTIASVYTRRELTFKKATGFVPKIWKRFIIAFFFLFLAFFLYNFLALVLIIIICLFIVPYPLGTPILLFIVLIIYVMGFVYITIIWQLASVVSVLESSYGLKAMTKSKDYLIKGNRVVAVLLFFVLNVSIIQFSFESLMVLESSLEAWKRVAFGVLCLLLLSIVFLFGFVIHTTLFLVRKSYHHENINKGDLSDHLESNLVEYEPPSGKDVQQEQYDI